MLELAMLLWTATAQGKENGQDPCFVETICQIQHAIRWKEPAWSHEFCERVEQGIRLAALKYDIDGRQLAAMALNESDFRPRAERAHREGRPGAPGPDNPTTTGGETAEATGASSAERPRVVDVGLMGVTCVIGKHGLCTNKFVRGLTPEKLKDPVLNLEIGAKILTLMHGGNLRSYNGGVTKKGYPRRIETLTMAVSGDWEAAGRLARGRRIRKMVRQINAAVFVALGECVSIHMNAARDILRGPAAK